MQSEPATHGHKRRQHFIKKEFQTKFMLKFCLIILVGAVISTGLLFLFSQETLTTSFNHSSLEIKKTAFAILPEVLLTNLITLAIIAIVSILVTLYISHKIAGPMYRFEKEIEQITQGNLTHRITLRNQDQITEIADQLNLMLESLHGKIQYIRSQVDGIQALSEGKTVSPEIREKLVNLSDYLNKNFQL